jgi:hypothetical protein
MLCVRLAVPVIMLSGTLIAADTRTGTWKLNLEKSKVQDPARWKSRLMIFEAIGPDAYRVTFEDTRADGTVTRRTDVFSFDGKKNPTVGGRVRVARRIDDHHAIDVIEKDGKEVERIEEVISPDGRTMTNHLTGIYTNGKPMDEMRVWEKQ